MKTITLILICIAYLSFLSVQIYDFVKSIRFYKRLERDHDNLMTLLEEKYKEGDSNE